jgi:hypothetical protein
MSVLLQRKSREIILVSEHDHFLMTIWINENYACDVPLESALAAHYHHLLKLH